MYDSLAVCQKCENLSVSESEVAKERNLFVWVTGGVESRGEFYYNSHNNSKHTYRQPLVKTNSESRGLSPEIPSEIPGARSPASPRRAVVGEKCFVYV